MSFQFVCKQCKKIETEDEKRKMVNATECVSKMK